MTKERNCEWPGCTAPALLHLKGRTDLEWLCVPHAGRVINDPANMAMTEADAELAEFRDGGGKTN